MNASQYQHMRKAMLDSQLRPNGVRSAWILETMGRAAREEFVPAERATTAYMDRAIPLAGGRMLNTPMSTALMLQEADIQSGEQILLIGSATGYVTGLLAARAGKLVALEENAALAKVAPAPAANVQMIAGPLVKGWAALAPYDLIIIDGAIEALPQGLVSQLREGGRLVTGMSHGPVQRLAIGYRWGDTLSLRPFIDCEIAPLSAFAAKKEFAF